MLRVFAVNLIAKRFAGHSKWANIRHVKGTKDAQRGLLFGKLSRQIKVAVTEGGSIGPTKNPKLKQIIDQCKRFNMPSATMQSVLKSCSADKTVMKLCTFDFKGPGSCIMVCEMHTSNTHHSKQLLATLLRKHKAKFIDGSGLHLFEEKGIIQAENETLSSKPEEEQLEMATEHAIESNAEEVTVEDKIFSFLCNKDHFAQAQDNLEKFGYQIITASVDYIPQKTQRLNESEFAAYEKLMGKLYEMTEVVRVFDNAEPSS
uniref:Uncharacterized protein n=1 Tax=Dendroctonus ponderosae TaxID=77166 RepID=J3JXT5_DENPD|nr:unknown [Dendroctonus ponderosae]